MESVYVTLYPSDDSLVNGQVLHVHLDCWDVRLSAPLARTGAMPATFWLTPAPANCRVRVVDTREDPVTGELRARLFPIDLAIDANVIDDQIGGERRRRIG